MAYFKTSPLMHLYVRICTYTHAYLCLHTNAPFTNVCWYSVSQIVSYRKKIEKL